MELDLIKDYLKLDFILENGETRTLIIDNTKENKGKIRKLNEIEDLYTTSNLLYIAIGLFEKRYILNQYSFSKEKYEEKIDII